MISKRPIVALLCCCLLVLGLSACDSADITDPVDEELVETVDNADLTEEDTAEETNVTDTDETVGTVAEYEGCTAEILDGTFLDDYEGAPAFQVTIRFQNDNADPYYLLESFSILAFQDGVEIEYVSLNDESEAAQNTITALTDGASLDCVMVFATDSDSPVELSIYTPTAEAVLLAQQSYTN